jgi:ribokinase
MVGCRGDDEFGSQVQAALRAEGVDVDGIRTVAGAPTGLALITVDEAGENAITVAAGANGRAGPAEADAAFAAPCDALVMSAEIPASVLAAALARARDQGVVCVLNLAPVPPEAHSLLAAGVDWLVVNGPEAAAVLGQAVPDLAGARDSAARLVAAGARNAVVTLGAQGAVLDGAALDGAALDGAALDGAALDGAVADGAVPGGAGGAGLVPGFRVRSVDSVGAGDAFVAALGVALAAGVAPLAAVRLACAAGAAAVTRRGAQAGLPRPADVLATTGLTWPLG